MIEIIRQFADSGCLNVKGYPGYCTGLPSTQASTDQLQQILQIAFGVAAALAVLFVVLAGLRFVTGSTNPQEIAKARNTIIYALVGLLVALSAEAIVTFALSNL